MIKRSVLAALLLLLLWTSAFSEEIKSFGGVWLGTTSFSEGNETALNVGSFFLAKTPLLGGKVFFGYAVSASTEVAVEAGAVSILGAQAVGVLTGVAQLVPLEANLALVQKFGDFVGWLGGGISVAYADVSVSTTYAFSLLGSTYVCYGDVEASSEAVTGFQLFLGGEYIFGSVGLVGGTWGVFLQAKYQYLGEVTFESSGTFTCQDLSGTSSRTVSTSDSFSTDLSNYSVVGGITYHF